MPVRREQPREGVAERGAPPCGGDRHRTGRVGAHELDQDSLGVAARGRPERVAGTEQRDGRLAVPAVGEEQVEESGAGDLDPLGARGQRGVELGAQPVGDLARRRAERRGEQHRGVRGVVAEPGLRGALEGQLRVRLAAELGDGSVHRGAELGERVCRRAGGHVPMVVPSRARRAGPIAAAAGSPGRAIAGPPGPKLSRR